MPIWLQFPASFLFVICLSLPLSAQDNEWNRFRGPNGSGIVPESDVANEWSSDKNLKWKVELPGPGSSSPIVQGDRVFVTCYTGYGLNAKDPGNRADLKRHLLCFDRESGKELWKLSYGDLGFSNASRPIAGNGKVFMTTGYMQAQLLAIDFKSGDQPEVSWKYRKQVPNVSSPLLVGNEIFIVSDKGIASCIDAETGKAHWTQRIGKNFWSSPLYADGKIYFLF